MKVYIAVCCDRHTDDQLYVFTNATAAIARAQQFVEETAAHAHAIKEPEQVDGCLYYQGYSSEGGDNVRVEEHEVAGGEVSIVPAARDVADAWFGYDGDSGPLLLTAAALHRAIAVTEGTK